MRRVPREASMQWFGEMRTLQLWLVENIPVKTELTRAAPRLRGVPLAGQTQERECEIPRTPQALCGVSRERPGMTHTRHRFSLEMVYDLWVIYYNNKITAVMVRVGT